MNPLMMWRLALGALLLSALVPTAHASTLMALDVPSLTRGSERVIHGRVLRATSHWRQGTGRIFTEAEVAVDEVLAGPEGRSSVYVVLPGGTVGDLRQDVAGAPRLAPGEEVVLFLARGPRGHWRVVGLTQGVFQVRLEEAEPLVVPTARPGSVHLVDPLSLQPVAPPTRTMRLSALRAQVRAALRTAVSPAPVRTLATASATADEPPESVRTRLPSPDGSSEGHCLTWSAGETLTFHSQACSPTEPDCAGRQQGVSQALQAWDEVLAGCTSLRLAQGAAPVSLRAGYVREGPNENVLVLRERACTPEDAEGAECWSHGAETLGLATVSFSQRTGRMLDADIELNAVAVYSQAPGDGLREVVLHELGHVLGLDHSPDPRSTMYATVTPGARPSAVDEGSRRAMCAIYPRGAPAVDCVPEDPEVQRSPLESGGCRAAPAGAGPGWLALGALLLARRSRRVARG